MNTWICKRGLVAFACALSLGACVDAPSLNISPFAPKSRAAQEEQARPDVSLARTMMAKGALELVPPEGFCIDKRGLKEDFAIVARCDALGGSGDAFVASLGLILVSVTPSSADADVIGLLPASFGPEVTVLERYETDSVALAHLDGDVPDGADTVHWRGLTQINRHLISFTAYAPKNGSLATAEGGRVLTKLADRMAHASQGRIKLKTAVADNSRQKGGLRDRFSGLFNRKAFIE